MLDDNIMIKDDISGNNKINVFNCIMIILHHDVFKSPFNLMIEKSFLIMDIPSQHIIDILHQYYNNNIHIMMYIIL